MNKIILCSYCGAPPELVSGEAVYPHWDDLADKKFYLCRPCGAYVGCHQGTDRPLGRLADAELRKAKQAAHAAFDPLWAGKTPKGKARREAYRALADKFGIKGEIHIGEMDVEQCRKVVEFCSKSRIEGVI